MRNEREVRMRVSMMLMMMVIWVSGKGMAVVMQMMVTKGMSKMAMLKDLLCLMSMKMKEKEEERFEWYEGGERWCTTVFPQREPDNRVLPSEKTIHLIPKCHNSTTEQFHEQSDRVLSSGFLFHYE